jgi:hypothetical protein
MASDRVGSLGPSLEIRNTNWSAKKKKQNKACKRISWIPSSIHNKWPLIKMMVDAKPTWGNISAKLSLTLSLFHGFRTFLSYHW